MDPRVSDDLEREMMNLHRPLTKAELYRAYLDKYPDHWSDVAYVIEIRMDHVVPDKC